MLPPEGALKEQKAKEPAQEVLEIVETHNFLAVQTLVLRRVKQGLTIFKRSKYLKGQQEK